MKTEQDIVSEFINASFDFFLAIERVSLLRFKLAFWLLGDDVSKKLKSFRGSRFGLS